LPGGYSREPFHRQYRGRVREFGNKPDIVSVGTKPVDNLFVDTLIRDDFHPAKYLLP
jgi:hypothetical protein